MNTAIATGRGNMIGEEGQFAGIGLAIPMEMIELVVDQLIGSGEIHKGYLGVEMRSLHVLDTMTSPSQMELNVIEHFDGQGVPDRGSTRGTSGSGRWCSCR